MQNQMCLEAKRNAFRTNVMRLTQDNVVKSAYVNTWLSSIIWPDEVLVIGKTVRTH